MSRLDRKKRDDIVYKGCGGITDILDDAIKEGWRINDDELDYIAEFASDDELDIILNEKVRNISENKIALKTMDELLKKMYDNE